MPLETSKTIIELKQSAETLRRAANSYNDPLLGDAAFVCGNAAELLERLKHAEWSQRALVVLTNYVRENDPEMYEKIRKLKIH